MIHPISSLPLSSSHRVSQVTFHPTEPYLAVQSHDHSVEIFRMRTEDEVQKKRARRKKREKEKKKDKAGKGDEDHDLSKDNNDDPEIKLVDLFTPHAVVRASSKIRSFSLGSAKNSIQVITESLGFALILILLASFSWR